MKNEDLNKRVEELINNINLTHRYSMSKIYGLFNEVFNTNEVPQSCASCLIRKKMDLEKWLANNKYIPPYLVHINKL